MNTGSEKQRDRDEKVVEIEIERLHDFKNHPFKIQSDSQMKELQDSISKYEIIKVARLRMESLENYLSTLFTAGFFLVITVLGCNEVTKKVQVYKGKIIYRRMFKSWRKQ